jgi:hypothetical protein
MEQKALEEDDGEEDEGEEEEGAGQGRPVVGQLHVSWILFLFLFIFV